MKTQVNTMEDININDNVTVDDIKAYEVEVEDVTEGAKRVVRKAAEKKAFDVREALANRRNDVIAKYNELTSEEFFNQISLKGFMMQVLRIFNNNRIRTQKEFDGKFANLLGVIYVDNCSIYSDPATDKDLKMKKMYKGTAMMALV